MFLIFDQAEQLQANSRMLAEKLRQSDQRAVAAESSAESGRHEVQGLRQRLNAAERESDQQSKAHRKTVQELEAKLAELTSQVVGQTPERSRPASSAPQSSPEGVSVYLKRCRSKATIMSAIQCSCQVSPGFEACPRTYSKQWFCPAA